MSASANPSCDFAQHLAQQAVGARLRTSPNFALSLNMDGRAYVAQDCEPYAQYWLSDSERLLYSLFATPAGMSSSEALESYFRLKGAAPDLEEIDEVAGDIEAMHRCGVLLEDDDDTSRYTAEIVEAYLQHRPFPPQLTDHIVARGGLHQESRVLDLAGGPGDLALQLARTSSRVALMELSRGFLDAAAARAVRGGLALTTHHDSCNRLLHHDGVYDAITISQALHWMDDIQLCRGVCRTLTAQGDFFVVHSAMTLGDAHPLAYLLGDNSILGARPVNAFTSEVRSLARRLNLIFSALEETPGAQTKIETRAVDISLFHQVRPIDGGFARAFMTATHIESTGLSEQDFWADLDARLASVAPQELDAVIDWAVLHFQRGPADDSFSFPEILPASQIGFARPDMPAPVHLAGGAK